ncbi:diguanylate cyclase [Evansella tamaricis]|uniref:Diguanylate cyclase n=1 Tax=Evansella tamaricis TaxID=2069301 RepID=A0ABS6JNH1_9BACI|nr:diguanylate cyclase [Evansella tamaricis]MBU9713858.1 diguanylate cyclase [Evansella tamaricis]
MQWVNSSIYYFLLSFILSFILAILSYNYRHTPGKRFFFVLALIISTIPLLTLFEVLSTSFQAKLWWRNIQQAPLVLASLFTFALIMDYTGKHAFTSKKFLSVLFIPNFIFLSLIFTDQYHHLMRSSVGLYTANGLTAIVVEPTLLNIILMIYPQIVVLMALAVLLSNLRYTQKYNRKQHIILFVGLCIPTLTVVFLPLMPSNIIGIIALSFLPGALVLYYGLFKHKFLSTWPISKDKIFDNLREGIILTDQHDLIVDINASAKELLSKISSSNLEMEGQSIIRYIKSHADLQELYLKKTEDTREIFIEGKGEFYTIRIARIFQHAGEKMDGTLLIFTNITDKKRYEESLLKRATHDSLTGLYNRGHFVEQVNLELKKPELSKTLMLIDLDNFKHINDTYGHLAGDDALIHFTKTLMNNNLEHAIVGRIGGDEFAIFLKGLSNKESYNKAESIRDTIEKTFIYLEGNTPITITISIGLVYIEKGNVASFREIYHNADKHLYSSKGAGKNRVSV